jgi:hypothetical protein
VLKASLLKLVVFTTLVRHLNVVTMAKKGALGGPAGVLTDNERRIISWLFVESSG